MATIIPFRAIRYNSGKVENLADVIAPPYDVITGEEQERLYRCSPYNFIRLEYGKIDPEDRPGENRYSRAAAYLKAWLEDGVLLQEEKPSFYLYQQSFNHLGTVYRRTGLIAALKLEPYSNKVVLPHEDTLASPKADRLELMRSCRANFSPVFGLFPDPDQHFFKIADPLMQGEPLYDFAGFRDERHLLWQVDGKAAREQLARLLAPQQIFIADGHHRYDTALRFSQENGTVRGPGSDYALAVLVPQEDPGLLILPFHRLLSNLSKEQMDLLLERVSKHFMVKEYSAQAPLAAKLSEQEQLSMGLLLPRRKLMLTARESYPDEELDVALLKRLLLDPLFDSDEVENHLDFVTGEEEAVEAVAEGRAQAAFLLKATPLEAVTTRALEGENMPQKSTCFHPKLPSGLAIHHLDWSY